jgi:hypothetical protein
LSFLSFFNSQDFELIRHQMKNEMKWGHDEFEGSDFRILKNVHICREFSWYINGDRYRTGIVFIENIWTNADEIHWMVDEDRILDTR